MTANKQEKLEARRLAAELGIRYVEALRRVRAGERPLDAHPSAGRRTQRL